MKVLIADDEPPARARLRQLLDELGGHECCAEAGDGVAALAACAAHHPEAVLLDIRMPRMDGIETARHLAELDRPPAIIFTTAYDDFALQAFEANAVHYLVKPVRRDALTTALERARQRAGTADAGAAALSRGPRSHLAVRSGERVELIPVDEIVCLRADQKYVEILTPGGCHLTESSLIALEREFSEQFLRVHRNALVRIGAIAGIDAGGIGPARVLLRGLDARIEVSRRHLPGLRRTLKRRLTRGGARVEVGIPERGGRHQT